MILKDKTYYIDKLLSNNIFKVVKNRDIFNFVHFAMYDKFIFTGLLNIEEVYNSIEETAIKKYIEKDSKNI